LNGVANRFGLPSSAIAIESERMMEMTYKIHLWTIQGASPDYSRRKKKKGLSGRLKGYLTRPYSTPRRPS
jgi:hypothetical protein